MAFGEGGLRGFLKDAQMVGSTIKKKLTGDDVEEGLTKPLPPKSPVRTKNTVPINAPEKKTLGTGKN